MNSNTKTIFMNAVILSVVIILKIECKRNEQHQLQHDKSGTEIINQTKLPSPFQIEHYNLTQNRTNTSLDSCTNTRTDNSSKMMVFLAVLFIMFLIFCCMSMTQK